MAQEEERTGPLLRPPPTWPPAALIPPPLPRGGCASLRIADIHEAPAPVCLLERRASDSFFFFFFFFEELCVPQPIPSAPSFLHKS